MTKARVPGALLTLLTLVLVVSCASTPSSAAKAAADDLVRKEIEVGEAAFAKLAGQYGVVKDAEATRYLTLFVRSMATYSSRQELTLYAAILNVDDVNAYSLPGGFILITKGLLKRVPSTGALAGVLAHELGHIDYRHILKNVTIKTDLTPLETLARFLAGSRQVITGAVDQINTKIEERLFLEGFAASDEYDADAYAVNLLTSLDLSATDYRDFLAAVGAGEDSARAALDRTHPPMAGRISRVDALLVPGLKPLGGDAEFQAFKKRLDTF